jgi:hypothetical protein
VVLRPAGDGCRISHCFCCSTAFLAQDWLSLSRAKLSLLIA